MNFLELAKKRYSVRNYSPKPIEKTKLDYILECGRIAPSAANYQPWKVMVIDEGELKQKIERTYNRDWLKQAPVILVFLADHRQSWKRADGKDHADIDLAIIVDHITLAAAEQDLGTCWICNFDAAKCRNILDLPDHLEPVAYLSLGYPSESNDDNSRHLKRKQTHEIVSYNKL
jgi:nitroreductase